MLALEEMFLFGEIWDTMTLCRVLQNNHLSYSLDACAKRIGLEKSNAVEDYIREHKLFTQAKISGKDKQVKNKHFDQVPIEIMQPYAEQDARIVYLLGMYLKHEFERLDNDAEKYSWPKVSTVAKEEILLIPTLMRMQTLGVRIDRDFCERAERFEKARQEKAMEEFKALTGKDFIDSALVFKEVFKDEVFVLTEKGNPSFSSDILKTFSHPAAKSILEYRAAKSSANFYLTFLYEADKNGDIHADFKSGGADTGRFSCANPNLQNLTKSEGDDLLEEFIVRRAIVPRDEFFFFMPDYSQMEYRLMLDYGGNEELCDLIISGFDVHEATAQKAGITRSKAKNGNFATLYGAGIKKLAAMLECTEAEAKAIRDAIFQAAPGMRRFIRQAMNTAEKRGFIWNCMGRRSHFPDPRFVYQAPNKIIQGGCADIMKKVMTRVHALLFGKKSRLVLNVHDELVLEIHFTELSLCSEIVSIMEGTYEFKSLPLKVDAEFSFTSLADKRQGIPSESEVRDYFQKKSREMAS